MMENKMETERLLLYPASDKDMRELVERETDPDLKSAYREMLEGCLREPDNRLWYAAWFMELKGETGVIVGDFCFKGAPSSDGAVEIGYGLRDGFCGKGYMREALKAILVWAFEQPCVKCVEAETEPTNTRSQRVLFACGFVPTGEIGEEGPRFSLQKP